MGAFMFMDQEVAFSRSSATTDAEGRPVADATSWVEVGRVQELSAGELPQGGALGEETTAMGVFDPTANIRAQDSAVATDAQSGIVRSYRVVAVHPAVSALLVDLRRDGA